jgi:hypothetical protein
MLIFSAFFIMHKQSELHIAKPLHTCLICRQPCLQCLHTKHVCKSAFVTDLRTTARGTSCVLMSLSASGKSPPSGEAGRKQCCRLQVLHRRQDRGLHSSGQADAQGWRQGQGAHIPRASHTESMDGCLWYASAGL